MCVSFTVDTVLENFSQQQSVWRYCVHFLQHSENQHVLMYSLNVIEVNHFLFLYHQLFPT